MNITNTKLVRTVLFVQGSFGKRLDEQVNEWLIANAENINVLDIKFSYGDLSLGALVVYELKEIKKS